MLRLARMSHIRRISSGTLSSFPLLGRYPFKYILYPSCLLFKELRVLGTCLALCYVRGGAVLMHKVGVFGTRAPKVLDLHDFGKNGFVEMIHQGRCAEVSSSLAMEKAPRGSYLCKNLYLPLAALWQ